MELRQLTSAVCQIARQAGAYIRNERSKFSLESVECKHAHDYVSYVDKGSEQLIVTALRQLLPEAGFITEEGLAGHNQEQLLWVVDPLDGTTNFIHQYAPYAVSIALLQGHEVLLGVVYEVCHDECFYAWQGGGAYMDGQLLHVSTQKINDALLCLQLPYNSDAYKPVIKRLIDELYGHVGSIRMCGSAAMALCYVAAGRYDGYAEQYIGQWDFMAGALIVKEAGGTVTNYEGETDFTQGNSVVATNGIIQSDLLKHLTNEKPHDKKKQTIDSSMVDRAICFATKAHSGVVRKGTKIPYIAHPLEAMAIVGSITDDQELLSAAVLHDVVEDAGVNVADIRTEFGDRVAALVDSETDSEVPGMSHIDSWQIRKQAAIDHLAAASRDVKIVALGDKLSNMRAMLLHYHEQGEQVWQRFNQKDPACHAWYYRQLVKSLSSLSDTDAFQEFAALVDQVFSRYEK